MRISLKIAYQIEVNKWGQGKKPGPFFNPYPMKTTLYFIKKWRRELTAFF